MQAQEAPIAYRFGDYTIIPAERRLLRADTPLEVEAKVLDLILLLLEHRERALDKRTLIGLLWGRRPVTDTALSQLVHKARRALDDDGERQTMIRTVYGRGLQWAAPTQPVWPDTNAQIPSPIAARAPPPADASSRRRRTWPILAACAAVIAIGIVLAALHRTRTTPALPRLALLPLENATGMDSLDWTRRGLPGLVGSLLGETGAVDVADALQTAQAWDYTAVGDRSQAERLRYATGATILIEGRLRKLGDDLYELDLHVDGGDAAHSGEVVVSAAQPATLGVDAVPRILRILQRQATAGINTHHDPAGDAYLAQTFARGVDLATHGDWRNAKVYFALCVQNAPDFLPARLRLGEAQANTRDFAESNVTLRALAEDARKQDAPAMQAGAMIDLAENELRRGDRNAALSLLESAAPLAQRGGDPDAQARLALLRAQAQAILKRDDAAAASLRRGRDLIEAHGLRQRMPLLHYTEELMAEERRDFPAQEAAARAALAAAEAIGDEHAAISETYRLGRMQSWQERPFAAIPLLARAWQRARERQMLDIEAVGGVELVWVLVETGLNAEACQVADVVVDDVESQENAYWKAIALTARARCRRTRGDAAQALADYRAAWSFIDPDEDPQLASLVVALEALAAFAAERDALPGIVRHGEQIRGDAADPALHRHSRRLAGALASAASGDTETARSLLAEEAADPDPDDAQANDVRRFALRIALATDVAAIAAIAGAGLDTTTNNDAEVLRLLREWSLRRDDTAARDRADARLADLHRRALEALGGVDFSVPPQRTSVR